MLRVGQKVVCVDARTPPIRDPFFQFPIVAEGHAYTIAQKRVDPWTSIPSVRLAEVPDDDHGNIWFKTSRFEPAHN